MTRKPKAGATGKPIPRKRAPHVRVTTAALDCAGEWHVEEADSSESIADMLAKLFVQLREASAVSVQAEDGVLSREAFGGGHALGGRSPVPPPPPNPQSKGSIASIRDLLTTCHQFTTAIENVADRLLGPVPEAGAKSSPPLGEIDATIGIAEALLNRLVTLNQRISTLSPVE